MNMTKLKLANYIDSTILKQNSSYRDVEILCNDAKNYNFASVCVLPIYVSYASNLLDKSNVKVCSVVGFPLGANLICTKLEETESLIENGCNEIDMVISIPSLINGNYNYIQEEIEAVTELSHSNNAIVKVIIETCLLNEKQKIEMCRIVSDSGADYIKTSTGFSIAGAQLDDIILFKNYLIPNVKIKASGGIKNIVQALEFIDAGAMRIGTSSGKEIINGMDV